MSMSQVDTFITLPVGDGFVHGRYESISVVRGWISEIEGLKAEAEWRNAEHQQDKAQMQKEIDRLRAELDRWKEVWKEEPW